MRYTGLQPQYFPRLHYFARILDTDLYMIRDDAQFVRKHLYPDGKTGKSYQADTPIKQSHGLQFLSVPVTHNGFQSIADTKISYNADWISEHLKTIETAYGKSQNFSYLFPELTKLLSSKYQTIADLTSATTYWAMLHLLGEETVTKDKLTLAYVEKKLQGQNVFRLKHIKLGSQTETARKSNTKRNETIIALMKEVGADEDYCGGTAMAAYMDENIFEKNNIKIIVQDWTGKEYEQQFMKQLGFIPNLSVLDLLMNVSPEQAVKIIKG